MTECPWVAVKDVCHMYGVKYDVALNKIRAGTFDVRTYKVGRIWVIDRLIHEQFFAKKRDGYLLDHRSTGG